MSPKFVIFWHFAIFTCSVTFGSITNPPVDKEAVRNQPVTFSCTVDTNANKIEWHHTPVGSTIAKTVFADNTVFNSYRQRLSVSCIETESRCTLTIDRVSAVDAGRYICVQGRFNAGAELSVFDTVPSDQSCHIQPSSTSDAFIGSNDCRINPDVIKISCSFKYFGNMSPSLMWNDEKQAVIQPEPPVTKNNVTISSVQFQATVNKTITCRIRYASSNLTSMFFWITSLPVETFLNTTRYEPTSCYATTVTCSHQYSSRQCESSWKMKNGSSVSDQTLRPDVLPSGVYVCVAICTIRSKRCAVQQFNVNHECAKDSSTSNSQSSSDADVTIILAAVLPTITIIAIGLVVFIKCKDRIMAEHCCKRSTTNDRVADNRDNLKNAPVGAEGAVLLAGSTNDRTGTDTGVKETSKV